MAVSHHTLSRLRWAVPGGLALLGAICLPLGIWLEIDVVLLIGAFATGFAFLTALDSLGVLKDGFGLNPRPAAEQRVKQLVEALTESTKVISEIEREVNARTVLANRLQADIERHQELLELNRSEVEAVAQTVAIEVRREGREPSGPGSGSTRSSSGSASWSRSS